MTLAKNLIGGRFRASVKVGMARLEWEGKEVTGSFKNHLEEFSIVKAPRMLEDLANSPNMLGNVKFTRKYGPLDVAPTPGAPFSIEDERFFRLRDRMREMWKQPEQYREINLREVSEVVYSAGSLTYFAKDLYSYACLFFAAQDVGRIRVCSWEACSNRPYFIAAHLKKRFCSAKCAELGRLKAKREWWEKHGTAWRAGRRDGGDENGT
jgi:hypothetical protein